jgi:hypothetical protein
LFIKGAAQSPRKSFAMVYSTSILFAIGHFDFLRGGLSFNNPAGEEGEKSCGRKRSTACERGWCFLNKDE